MEHYLAVDNVCAWPNLTLLPDGSILANIFNQPCHGKWEGDVECWASEDGGQTWQLRGVPAPHEPTTNRMNVAAGRTASDQPIVLASGWSNRNPVGQPSSPMGNEVLPIWACHSDDAGHTWQHTTAIAPEEQPDTPVIPFGDIIVLPDDELGVCFYTWDSDTEGHSAHFYVSNDSGHSWRMTGVISSGNTNETTPLLLSTGDLLAASRTINDGHLELFRSEDRGRTWSAAGALTDAGHHPAHMLNLANGNILLTYGLRGENPWFQGIGARLSTDQGQSWSEPKVLTTSNHAVDWSWPASDGGYPSTVQCSDRHLVTAYYTSQIPRHQRYHMAVMLWELDEVFA
jgi:hypothetical protein